MFSTNTFATVQFILSTQMESIPAFAAARRYATWVAPRALLVVLHIALFMVRSARYILTAARWAGSVLFTVAHWAIVTILTTNATQTDRYLFYCGPNSGPSAAFIKLQQSAQEMRAIDLIMQSIFSRREARAA